MAWLYINAGPDGFIGLDLPDDTLFCTLYFTRLSGVTGVSQIEWDHTNEYNNHWITEDIEEFVVQPHENFFFPGSIEFVESITSTVPDPVAIISPLDGATNAGKVTTVYPYGEQPTTELSVVYRWERSDIAIGYNLHINGEVLDMGNLLGGKASSYYPISVFNPIYVDYDTEYTWKVVP